MNVSIKNIRYYLLDHGMTQGEFAERCGSSKQNINNIIRHGTCRLKTAEKFAEILGCSVEELGQDARGENPYWERICDLAVKQRAKGMATYGQGLEMNPMAVNERLEYLEEELIDGLMYIEHIKAWLAEGKHDQD